MCKETLDELIQSLKQNNPNDGEVVTLQQKIRILHRMLHALIHCLDHENVIV